MGIKLWFSPQISEHWPKNNPGRIMINVVWFRRPGVESILIPREGRVQAWITSAEVVRIRMGKLKGRIHRLSTSRSRNSLGIKLEVGTINESNSILKKSEYSYLQYHWCPIVFKVNLLLWVSSVRYKIFKEGMAIKIRIIIGAMVQINSIEWPWSRKRFVNLLKIIINIIKKISIVIKIKIIIVKSWKKIIRS